MRVPSVGPSGGFGSVVDVQLWGPDRAKKKIASLPNRSAALLRLKVLLHQGFRHICARRTVWALSSESFAHQGLELTEIRGFSGIVPEISAKATQLAWMRCAVPESPRYAIRCDGRLRSASRASASVFGLPLRIARPVRGPEKTR